jgi:hypothetical protein
MDDLQGLVKYIRDMRLLKAVLLEGELLGVFSQRARDMNPRFWGKFWQLAGEGVRRSLFRSVTHLNKLLPTPWQDSLRIYCVQHKFLKANPQGFNAFTSFSRDPPKLFTPIPKIETGGCARSDSLVCSLIF